MAETPPVLYSFRRCPYAIRARMALAAAGVTVELREVLLKDKPAAMLEASPKGTVPVLVVPDGAVIDESVAVMRWALGRDDPEQWLAGPASDTRELIAQNDGPFKQWLDRYKYHVRHPEGSQTDYRQQAETILAAWESRLIGQGGFLTGASARLADVALFPFVRQFAGVEPSWWAQRPWPALHAWLQGWTEHSRFAAVMRKCPPWQPGQPPLYWELGEAV